ncbi:hypothetical protein T439DRAFT_320577 [Meredithblackwellia eburnea MCA 4105]
MRITNAVLTCTTFAVVSLAVPVFVLNSDSFFGFKGGRSTIGRRAKAPKFEQVVVFGDSLSDNGTGAWNFSNHTWPADPHYYHHSFSNGKVYAQDIAIGLGATLKDYAIGGATTNNTRVAGYTGPSSSLGPVPSVLDQVATFKSSLSSKSAKAKVDKTLFIVYGGANNVFFDINSTASGVVSDLKSAVTILKGVGASHFLVPSLPPLGKPYPFSTLVPSYSDPLAKFSSDFNKILKKWDTKDSSITVPDFYDLVAAILKKPSKYGFDPTKAGVSCLRGVYSEVPGGVTVCNDPSKYMWWDEYHPTKRLHALLAGEALKTLKSA